MSHMPAHTQTNGPEANAAFWDTIYNTDGSVKAIVGDKSSETGQAPQAESLANSDFIRSINSAIDYLATLLSSNVEGTTDAQDRAETLRDAIAIDEASGIPTDEASRVYETVLSEIARYENDRMGYLQSAMQLTERLEHEADLLESRLGAEAEQSNAGRLFQALQSRLSRIGQAAELAEESFQFRSQERRQVAAQIGELLSDPGDVGQIGAVLETLQPGALSTAIGTGEDLRSDLSLSPIASLIALQEDLRGIDPRVEQLLTSMVGSRIDPNNPLFNVRTPTFAGTNINGGLNPANPFNTPVGGGDGDGDGDGDGGGGGGGGGGGAPCGEGLFRDASSGECVSQNEWFARKGEREGSPQWYIDKLRAEEGAAAPTGTPTGAPTGEPTVDPFVGEFLEDPLAMDPVYTPPPVNIEDAVRSVGPGTPPRPGGGGGGGTTPLPGGRGVASAPDPRVIAAAQIAQAMLGFQQPQQPQQNAPAPVTSVAPEELTSAPDSGGPNVPSRVRLRRTVDSAAEREQLARAGGPGFG